MGGEQDRGYVRVYSSTHIHGQSLFFSDKVRYGGQRHVICCQP